MTEPLSTMDSLPVRDSGHWASDKLYYVDRYMDIFNSGMKNRWPRRGYIDLMSGPGRCLNRDTGAEFDGSPLLALRSEPAFARVVLVELDQANANALHYRTEADASRCTILVADCNAPQTIADIRAAIDPTMLTLCFVDNLGLTVTFETIRALVAGNRPIDLLFTFQVNDLARNVDRARSSDDGDRFDAFFGSPGWRDVIARFDRGQTDRSDRATALADFYGEQLATLGYSNFDQLHRVMTNMRNAPLYRLLIASRHPKAIEFFRKIAAIEHDGQRRMF